MTEAEWLAANDPRPMLEAIRDKVAERKLRLFAVACSRRVAQWMTDERNHFAIEVSELYADGTVGRKRLAAARRGAFAASKATEAEPRIEPYCRGTSHAAIVALHASSDESKQKGIGLAMATAGCACSLLCHLHGDAAERSEDAAQADLLRDIFGNPFRPVAFSPAWRTGTAVALARQMYESRDFGAMPILADALQDAGCDSEEVLSHCRGAGPHVRGCWAVDLVLGKA